MSVKPKDKVLTYEQARELKFFCRNVMGVRQDFYELFDEAQKFDNRLKRLEKTCFLIEEYFGEKIEAFNHVFAEIDNGSTPDGVIAPAGKTP